MTIYAVKHYNNTQTGAPVLSGTLGSGIAWLDAMLLNGFNSKSITTLTRTDTTATLGLVDHGFAVGDCIAISGVTNDTNWNGEYIILTADADQMTFSVPGTLDAAPSGTMIVKYPPISSYWTKVFSGTNQAIYRSTHPLSTGWFLRVDDAADGRYMTVSIIEGYTSFTTGLLNQYNVSWIKSNTESSAVRPWVFVGDAFRFYPMICWSDWDADFFINRRAMEGNFFGDILTTKPSDGYHCAIQGNKDASYSVENLYYQPGNYTYNSFCAVDESTSDGSLILRHHNQVGTQVEYVKASMYSTYRMGFDGYTYPNPSDNGVYFDNVWVYQGGGVRGKWPGVYSPINAIRHNLVTGDKTIVKDGKTYMYVRLAWGNYNDECGGCLFDVTYNTTGWTL